MRRLACLLFVPVLLAAAPAKADERVTPIANALVKKECGACHMAYQPSFLPAASWQKIMATLPNHFGEDATLPAAAAKEITAYLTTNARGPRRNADATPLRITKLDWFVREHGGREARAMAASRKVKTMAACQACHTGADNGDFDDD